MARFDDSFDPEDDLNAEDDNAFESGDHDEDFDTETIARYIVDEIARAFGAHDRAARGTVQRVLPLGEMLALFNLADQFGLIDRVRADLDARLGTNSYHGFSEAMKNTLLDRGSGPSNGRDSRPSAPRADGPRSSPRQKHPPASGRDTRPGPGRGGRPDGRPPRGGRSRG